MTLTEKIAEARRANAEADEARARSERERRDHEVASERRHTARAAAEALGVPVHPDEITAEEGARGESQIGVFELDGMTFQRYRSGLAWREPCPGCAGYILHQFQTVGDLARALDYAAANPERRCVVCEEGRHAAILSSPAAPLTPTEELIAALDSWPDARAGE